MKKIFIILATALCCTTLHAENKNYVLDLSNDTLSYNENGVWTGIYNNAPLLADGFVFSHTAPYGEGYYEGFIASHNTDTANHFDSAGWTANQWGCMAQGGVDLNGENSKSFYADAIYEKPFLINYFSAYSLTTSDYGTSYITMESLSTFAPEGIYVCNAPWGYHGCISGDGFATPLVEKNSYYKVTFNGVNTTTGTVKSVDYYLAECLNNDRNSDGEVNENDNYTNDHWSWCDLSTMGDVNLIYITMDSSDKGEYGMNNSTLVCLDGLEVATPASVNRVNSDHNIVYCADGYLYLTLAQAQEITLYNTTGNVVTTLHANVGTTMHNLQHLPQGIYIVKHNNGCKKIVL